MEAVFGEDERGLNKRRGEDAEEENRSKVKSEFAPKATGYSSPSPRIPSSAITVTNTLQPDSLPMPSSANSYDKGASDTINDGSAEPHAALSDSVDLTSPPSAVHICNDDDSLESDFYERSSDDWSQEADDEEATPTDDASIISRPFFDFNFSVDADDISASATSRTLPEISLSPPPSPHPPHPSPFFTPAFESSPGRETKRALSSPIPPPPPSPPLSPPPLFAEPSSLKESSLFQMPVVKRKPRHLSLTEVAAPKDEVRRGLDLTGRFSGRNNNSNFNNNTSNDTGLVTTQEREHPMSRKRVIIHVGARGRTQTDKDGSAENCDGARARERNKCPHADVIKFKKKSNVFYFCKNCEKSLQRRRRISDGVAIKEKKEKKERKAKREEESRKMEEKLRKKGEEGAVATLVAT